MSKKVISKPIKSNKLYFDKISIIREIQKKNEYKDNDIIIKRWEGDEKNANMYF
jgi:hypothetical protein